MSDPKPGGHALWCKCQIGMGTLPCNCGTNPGSLNVGAPTLDARRLSDELRQIIFDVCGQAVMQTEEPITLDQATTIQHRIEQRLYDLCGDINITNLHGPNAQHPPDLSEHDTEKGFIKEVNDALDKF